MLIDYSESITKIDNNVIILMIHLNFKQTL